MASGNIKQILDWVYCKHEEERRQRVSLLEAAPMLDGSPKVPLSITLEEEVHGREASMSMNFAGKPRRDSSSSK